MSAVEVDRATWDAALAAHPAATAFHRHDVLELAAAALGGRFAALALPDTDPPVLLPVLERRRGPVSTVGWVPFPYLGPLAADGDLPRALRALLTAARRRRAVLVQCAVRDPGAATAPALRAAGFTLHDDRTLEVPIAGRDAAACWGALRGNGRRDVRAARDAGLTVRAATREDVCTHLPAMLDALHARGGETGWPARRTTALAWERLAASPHARMTTAVDADGTPVAVTIALHHGTRTHLWLGAAHRRDGIDPHALLYWDAIEDAAARGLDAVDLVGAPTPGIVAYKRKFGAVERPVLVGRRQRLPGYGRLQRGHARLTARRAAVA
ncbi:GNAT family N-acetyltransferase [Conexibacter sp. W3-3-2]|uniref:GNAT family N-acetyltransferase n=1 Tax=Conexibacter sp. W3-3-2 TaxID=2675227 RepID=UPI0012B6D2CB|nr:GNAT family N-acetyltransferase [Conexibacter sp. W3-3-2]MTD43044.1 GNAT family N-acetyltransferase [Conexibacter sp. W3-3-2]